MKKSFIGVVIVCLLTAAISSTIAGCKSKEKIVVYNWGEYIAEDTVQKFEEKFPMYEVVYRMFDDNEKMYPRIGKESFDVIIPSDYMVVRLIRENKLQKVDLSLLPNVGKYLDARIANLVYDTDTNLSKSVFEYAVPYLYCTVGLIYNTEEITLNDPTDPKEVWGILFDEKYKGRIGMYDSMRESIGTTLNYLGYSVNSTDDKEMDEAKALLIEQRKKIAPVLGIDTLKDKYVSGELVAGIAWSGDYVVCTDVLEEAGENPEKLGFALPNGSNFAVDMMCVPKNAKNFKGAMEFINFMYEPDIALANTEYAGFSSPVTAAVEMLDEEVKNNKMFYPDDEMFKTLEIYFSSDEIDNKFNSVWEEIMAN